MIIVLVIGFLLFVAVFAVRGHEERGYIHSDERDEYQEEYDSSEFGNTRFHKALFHPVFHARRVVDSMKTSFAKEKYVARMRDLLLQYGAHEDNKDRER